MPKAFLLQFQESCLEEVAFDSARLTATKTSVDREGAKDSGNVGGYVLSTSETGTVTRQEREGTDWSDLAFGHSRQVVPKTVKATKTVTEVRAEATDDDAGDNRSLRAVPSLSTPQNSGTKTLTYVKAEAEDQDVDRRVSFQVIQPCS